MSAVMNSFSDRRVRAVRGTGESMGILTNIPEVHIRLEHRVEVRRGAQF
jgi:hypothetical protein